MREIIISLVAVIIVTSFYVIAINANAQTAKVISDKQFELCPDVSSLSANTYTNGTNIQYQQSGCPLSYITIKNWNDIDPLTQQSITTELSAKGYTASKITPQLVCPDNVISDSKGNLITIDNNGTKTGDTTSAVCQLEVYP